MKLPTIFFVVASTIGGVQSANAQDACAKPTLTGFQNIEPVTARRAGSAVFSVRSPDTPPGDKVTFGVHLGFSSEQTFTHYELQFRGQLVENGAKRPYEVSAVSLTLDGRTFPGRISVQGEHPTTWAASWQKWYSDESLYQEMARSKLAVLSVFAGTNRVGEYRFDVSQVRELDRVLTPYWQCTVAQIR